MYVHVYIYTYMYLYLLRPKNYVDICIHYCLYDCLYCRAVYIPMLIRDPNTMEPLPSKFGIFVPFTRFFPKCPCLRKSGVL